MTIDLKLGFLYNYHLLLNMRLLKTKKIGNPQYR
jgi:hypothetical protein